MVTLAAACARPPTVLVADEATLGLAPRIVDEVLASFAALRDDGVTVLLIEEKARAVEVADRAAIIELGRVTWTGSPRDLDVQRLSETHLGRGAGDPAAPAPTVQLAGTGEV
jgi:ABC-type branched-subunit amino acid transport system ATPase component